jgi:hypothetical protein
MIFRLDVFVVLRCVHNMSGAWQYSRHFKNYMREGMGPAEAVECDKTYWGIADGGHIRSASKPNNRMSSSLTSTIGMAESDISSQS